MPLETGITVSIRDLYLSSTQAVQWSWIRLDYPKARAQQTEATCNSIIRCIMYMYMYHVCVVFLCSGFEIWIEKCMYVQDFLVYITLSMGNEQ